MDYHKIFIEYGVHHGNLSAILALWEGFSFGSFCGSCWSLTKQGGAKQLRRMSHFVEEPKN